MEDKKGRELKDRARKVRQVQKYVEGKAKEIKEKNRKEGNEGKQGKAVTKKKKRSVKISQAIIRMCLFLS